MGLTKSKTTDTQPSLIPAKEYLKASDIPATGLTLTIASALEEDVPKYNSDDFQKKMVVYFDEQPKGMVLNVVNWKTIEQLTGETEIENWCGAKLELYTTEVEVNGEWMPAFRIKQPIKVLEKIKKEEKELKQQKLKTIFS